MAEPARPRFGSAMLASLALAALASFAVPALAARHFSLAEAPRAIVAGADSTIYIFENVLPGSFVLLPSGLI